VAPTVLSSRLAWVFSGWEVLSVEVREASASRRFRPVAARGVPSRARGKSRCDRRGAPGRYGGGDGRAFSARLVCRLAWLVGGAGPRFDCVPAPRACVKRGKRVGRWTWRGESFGGQASRRPHVFCLLITPHGGPLFGTSQSTGHQGWVRLGPRPRQREGI